MRGRIALTGAAGNVATLVRPYLVDRYALHSTDRMTLRELLEGERFFRADLRSVRRLRRAFAGCDAVIHLGAISREARFDRLVRANILGTQTLLEAARAEGIRRVVIASTGHVTGFYPRRDAIDETSPVRPDTLYAVSKASCEALGRYYADKYGMEICCVRIGHVSDAPEFAIDRSIWCSPRDLAALFETVLEVKPLHFEIVYGVSDNARGWWRTDRARELGFVPRDTADGYDLRSSVLPPIGELVQGADYAARDFSGDVRRFA